jgi:putative transposase
MAKREKGIWQRRYWEHAIRDDADLSRHIDHVYFNPVAHGLVSRVRDWPYSSFRAHVAAGLLPKPTRRSRPLASTPDAWGTALPALAHPTPGRGHA